MDVPESHAAALDLELRALRVGEVSDEEQEDFDWDSFTAGGRKDSTIAEMSETEDKLD